MEKSDQPFIRLEQKRSCEWCRWESRLTSVESCKTRIGPKEARPARPQAGPGRLVLLDIKKQDFFIQNFSFLSQSTEFG